MPVLQKLKDDKILVLKTVILCVIYAIIGYGAALLGPTLLDLQIQVNETLEETAKIIPARAAGYAFGSLTAGLIPDKWPHEIIITASIAITSACFAIAPLCRTIYSLLTFITASGVFSGIFEVLASVYTFNLWDEDTALIIQIVYLCFGVGAMAAPLLAGPFLLITDEESTSVANHTGVSNTVKASADDLKLVYPYEIFALICLLTALSFGLTTFKSRLTTGKITEDKENTTLKQIPFLQKFCILLLATLVFHLYFGVEISFGSMLETYLVKGPPAWDKKTSAYVTSTFWTTYTFLRLTAILFLAYIGPFRFLVIQFFFVILANVVLLTASTSDIGLWIGPALMGTGLSSIFGLMLAYLRQYMRITSRMMASFCVAGCVGEFVYPMVIATYIDSQPEIFRYVIALSAVLMCITFAVLHVLCKCLYK